MEEPEVIEYPKCPVCNSEEVVVGLLAAKEINKGVNPAAIAHYLQTLQFVLRNQNYPVIIGSKSSAGIVFLDVCKECGILRALRVETGEAVALDRPPKMG